MAVAVAFLVAAGQLNAADDKHKWWLSGTSRAELGLTDRQSAEIDALFRSVLPRMRGEKEELERQEQALSALLAGASDEGAVAAAIDRVETARAAANKTRTWMLYRMYRVLSPEQRTKVAAMHERFERERRAGPRGPSRTP